MVSMSLGVGIVQDLGIDEEDHRIRAVSPGCSVCWVKQKHWILVK